MEGLDLDEEEVAEDAQPVLPRHHNVKDHQIGHLQFEGLAYTVAI